MGKQKKAVFFKKIYFLYLNIYFIALYNLPLML